MIQHLLTSSGHSSLGRANKVVVRAHLANVNRAATKGYSYRLLENGFISDY